MKVISNVSDAQSFATDASVTIVAVHLVNVAMFHLDARLVERLALAGLVILAASVGRFLLANLTEVRWAGLSLLVGAPAVAAGVVLHAVPVLEGGFGASDYTGVAMLLAGTVLVVIGLKALVRPALVQTQA